MLILMRSKFCICKGILIDSHLHIFDVVKLNKTLMKKKNYQKLFLIFYIIIQKHIHRYTFMHTLKEIQYKFCMAYWKINLIGTIF